MAVERPRENNEVALSKESESAAEQRLRDELDLITKELADLGVSPDGVVEVSFDEGFADAAQTTSERSNVLSLAEGLRTRLEDVRSALDRLEKGNYGRCERCGNEINGERLEAIPTARLCISCKQAVGA
jgi:DnaK suppressor protein